MLFNTAESILIVEASDTGKFSKLLYNMIGKGDSAEDEASSPAACNVEATIFNENQFAQTAVSSSQRVVFVGWPKGADDYIEAIRLENPDAIDEDGVYVGVSGKHACIQVNSEPPTKERYWDFLSRAKEHGMAFDDLLADLRDEEAERRDGNDDENPVLGFAKVIADLPPARLVSDVASKAGVGIALHQRAGKIREQRYLYAVRRFYKDKLRDFAEA